MRGKTMAERVTTDRLGNPGLSDRRSDGALHLQLMQMMAPFHPTPRIPRARGGGEDILPGPVTIGRGVFALQCVGQVHVPIACLEVPLMLRFHGAQMRL